MSTIFHALGQEKALPVANGLSALGEAAIKYAEQGWHVFPCHPNQKEPIPKIGQNAATTDTDKIARWWAANPDANIGIHLAPSGLLAVDVDSYKGEVVTPGELPPTLTQISARGGTHAIYKADPNTKYGRNGATNIDVKHKGYVLVAPSTFEGGTYRWQSDPAASAINPAPHWTVRPKLDRAQQAKDNSGRTLAEVEEALRHVSPDIPYDEWINVLMALHHGFGNEALTLAEEWSARSDNPDHAIGPDMVEDKFRSFDADTAGGITIAHVFHKAREFGADLGQLADKHRQENLLTQFAPAEPQELTKSIFEITAEKEREQDDQDVYPLLKPSDLASRPAPTFLIGRHIPQNGLGFLVAHPGVGKSFLALDMGLTIAAGLSTWQGEPVQPTGDGSVIYIASEGSFDLPLRIEAWKQHHGITDPIDNFRTLEASVNFMDRASVHKLIRSVKAINATPSLVVVDTVSRALPGADENAQKDMTLFVSACEEIKQAFQCAVMGLHHSAKSGGIRGSSVLEGAGDFVFIMEREKGQTVGTFFMHKQKADEDGWSYPFELPKIQLALDKPLPKGRKEWASLIFAKTSLNFPEDQKVNVSNAPQAAAEAHANQQYPFHKVIEAINRAWLDSKPWSKEPRAKGRYAIQLMQEQFDIPKAIAKAALDQWLATGQLESRVQNAHDKRPGLYVTLQYNSMSENDVFG